MNRIFVFALVAMLSFSANTLLADSVRISEDSNVLIYRKDKKKVEKVVYSVHIHCNSCVTKIKENISFVRGVKDLEVFLATKTVKIVYDPAKTNESKLETALKKIGYTPIKLSSSTSKEKKK